MEGVDWVGRGKRKGVVNWKKKKEKSGQVMHIGSSSYLIPVSSLQAGAQRPQVTTTHKTRILSRVAELGSPFVPFFSPLPVTYLNTICSFIFNIQTRASHVLYFIHLYYILGTCISTCSTLPGIFPSLNI